MRPLFCIIGICMIICVSCLKMSNRPDIPPTIMHKFQYYEGGGDSLVPFSFLYYKFMFDFYPRMNFPGTRDSLYAFYDRVHENARRVYSDIFSPMANNTDFLTSYMVLIGCHLGRPGFDNDTVLQVGYYLKDLR